MEGRKRDIPAGLVHLPDGKEGVKNLPVQPQADTGRHAGKNDQKGKRKE